MKEGIKAEIKIDLRSFQEFEKRIEEIKSSLSPQEINTKRAKKLKEFVIETVRNGEAGLEKLSSATKFLEGDHNPMFLTGSLLNELKYKPDGKNDVLFGFFDDKKKVPGKNITYYHLAEIHHTGYRIPLTGESGGRVIAWMKRMGLGGDFGGGKGSSRQWIVVPPRPFLYNSVNKYINTGKDREMTKKIIEKVIGK